MAIYAIGDVHGCHRTLRALLDRLPFDDAADELWLVGDLVNRGPASLEVLRWARRRAAELGDRMTVVLGNHDVHLLALAAGAGPRAQDRPQLAAVLAAPDGAELAAWLGRRPLLHRRGLGDGREVLLVHAGLLPEWTVEAAAQDARRAEEALRRRGGLEKLLSGSADLAAERQAFEALTRLRMLTAAGQPCAHTGAPEEAPPECVSWFDAPGRETRNAVVVCGHWAALGHRMRSDLVALDSGCVYGGALTAVRLDDRRVYQVPSQEG